jgi:hypothetical protein
MRTTTSSVYPRGMVLSEAGSGAMMQFRPVEHAITEDGEWVTVQQVLTPITVGYYVTTAIPM